MFRRNVLSSRYSSYSSCGIFVYILAKFRATIFSSSTLSKQLTHTTPLVCESHFPGDIHTIDVNRLISTNLNNLAGYEEMVGDVSQSETERYLLCMF